MSLFSANCNRRRWVVKPEWLRPFTVLISRGWEDEQLLSTNTATAEDGSLISNTRTRWLTIACNSSSMGPDTFSGLRGHYSWAQPYTLACIHVWLKDKPLKNVDFWKPDVMGWRDGTLEMRNSSMDPLMRGTGVFTKETCKSGCHFQHISSHITHALWKQALTRHRDLCFLYPRPVNNIFLMFPSVRHSA